MSINEKTIWVRGAGEIGSAAAVSLFRAGFRVILSEISPPLAIRRTVTFSDAILDGQKSVENIPARNIPIEDFATDQAYNFIPILLDDPDKILRTKPSIIIDARMIKSYDKDFRDWANHFIGFGPGFSAGINCHAVVETMRGHDLGHIINSGSANLNTGIPGEVGGETIKRVIFAPCDGQLQWAVNFGDCVNTGDRLGKLNEVVIPAQLDGMVRGLIHPNVDIKKGMKIADVDPRGKSVNYKSMSDKARSLGRAALEAVMIYGKEYRLRD